MHIGLQVKCLLFLSDFNECFFRQILEKYPEIPNFMKILLVGAELFRAEDRRTDMTKLRVVFRKFVNAPNRKKKLENFLLLDFSKRITTDRRRKKI